MQAPGSCPSVGTYEKANTFVPENGSLNQER